MKKRYIFAGIIIVFNLLNLITGKPMAILGIISLIYTLYLIHVIEKGVDNTEPLNRNEKLQVILTEILYPIISGGFYYYCLKNRFPKKASQANKYSWLTFLAILVVGMIAAFFIS